MSKRSTAPRLRQHVRIGYLIHKQWTGNLPLPSRLDVQRVFACTKGVAADALELAEALRGSQ